MIRFTVFSFLVVCLFATSTFAQYQLSGTVQARHDSAAIKGVTIYLDNGKRQAVTDSLGQFTFTNLPNGQYVLHTSAPDFKASKQTIALAGRDQSIRILVASRQETLAEVTVTDKQSDFGFTRMRGVESMGIYEGKKSEVIIPEQLVANLSTNNARQIYARVAGLNIWENEGAGLQLSIGGRGLDPNRSSNFNVRQNGYDISADALGYPESYYTPPTEAVGRIQIVRGAASLQYGTQFGGLLNFVMKKPITDRKFELTARQTIGSFGFYNAFTSASGTVGKLSYYTFFQYKKGDGWRPNSHFTNYTAFADVDYHFSEKTTLGVDITQMSYLAQQPGGLTDEMFREDPRQSNRERNWFKVNWTMPALHFDHKFNTNNEFNLRLFGLYAYRYSLGFRPNRVASIDDNSERDLIKGDFQNYGAEARYLKRYSIGKQQAVMLVGGRYYHGFNHSVQGLGSTGKDADFDFITDAHAISYDYRFPNRNVSAFAENIFYIGEKLSITPGVRFEYIKTTADGFYGTITRDLAGNIINSVSTTEYRTNGRQFLLGGIGISYKPFTQLDIYGNLSQNYRSITFTDMRIANPSSVIDPNMQDEKGYSLDVGIRSTQTTLYNFDVSAFYLNYNNRIGEVQFSDVNDRVLRRRGNIGQAVIMGIESYAEGDFLRLANPANPNLSGVIFANVALIHSTYKASEIAGVAGNQVEFVPNLNLKSGLRLGYKNLKGSFQYTHLSNQFSDATNATDGGVSAVLGLIPAYTILDASLSYQFTRFRLEGSLNNLANTAYFTRRATGYPGPGILPSDGRSFYLTVQVKL
ncbi:TonB-dependent receptor plug domain-containing protein [Spirosoma sp. HMF4905]|uniref:TonB-dependent receptor plug domain-containing protein n=1 Tax=Spirosoma arboris TaxID=2682092 RepID=A0A7K1SAF6_9BACT|nr:TonB-dependent receptor [Spirosoma arboris]MVM30823.1 TonB-dependent receptor plug domain-containing protein [Spirosoma arboris]